LILRLDSIFDAHIEATFALAGIWSMISAWIIRAIVK
jgi:hypothetical protein